MGRPRKNSREDKKEKCEFCGIDFIKKFHSTTKYCSRSCCMRQQHKSGKRNNINYNRKSIASLQKDRGFSDEEIFMRQKEAVKKRILTNSTKDQTRQKEAARKSILARNKSTIGKTYEEMYGKDRSDKMKENLSKRVSGKGNPAYGKVYQQGGKSIKGYYKNRYFRSLLEYSFMKHLERLGSDLLNDDEIDYECVRIPYTLDGKDRTYKIDFLDKKNKIAYEIKQSWAAKSDNKMLKAKNEAAQIYFEKENIRFSVMTELDFEKVKFDVAILDNNVIWDERTFKYFRQGKKSDN